MISLMLSFTLVVGGASQYAPGVMARVIHTRQTQPVAGSLPIDLPNVDGYVAVQDCTRIGNIVWLRPAGTSRWESFLVADCSGDAQTSRWMRRNHILVEVDHATAVRWHTVGHRIEIEQLTLNVSRAAYQ